MRISTRGRYATRALFDLAQHYGEGPVVLANIAERQEISEQYLEHLLSPLKVAGLVKSIRGASGGFILAKPPAEIRIGQIIEAVEGPAGITDCVDDPACCHRSENCPTRGIWAKASAAMANVFDSISLKDLINSQVEKTPLSSAIM
jgi:Rrf2 family cysteine metabolism transcriptional repressor